MNEKRPRFELWAESRREIGVLLLVFVPLDVIVELMHDSHQTSTKHWMVIAFALVGVGMFALGVEMERR